MIADIEAIAIHTAVWGDPEQVLDAIDTGAWIPEHFTDPRHRTTAQTIEDLVLAGTVPWPETIGARLMADGHTQFDAADMIDPPGAFQAAGCRLDGLGHWLTRLADARAREAVDRKLLQIGNQLAAPGGAQRAAAALGLEVAA